ncbi:MAG: HAD-IA family hydrolase, partial [Cyanobacteria bacterium P01_C01_bin.73]
AFRQVAASQLQRLAGLDALLDWIEHQGLKKAVVTNAPRPNAEFMLKTLNLWAVFDPVIIAEELPRAKPDPLPYQHALKQLNLQPENAIVFEDSASGIKAAVAAQIPTIGIATTHAPTDLYALGVELVIQDFTDPRLKDFGIQIV